MQCSVLCSFIFDGFHVYILFFVPRANRHVMHFILQLFIIFQLAESRNNDNDDAYRGEQRSGLWSEIK